MLSTKAGKMVSTEIQFDMQTKLNLITEHTIKDKGFKFTSLAHLLNETSLKECFHRLKKNKAPGLDQVTYEEYETYLNTNIQKLVKRMKAGKILPAACKKSLHNQRGRQGKTTRDTSVRRQDSTNGDNQNIKCDIRAELPGLFLWIKEPEEAVIRH